MYYDIASCTVYLDLIIQLKGRKVVQHHVHQQICNHKKVCKYVMEI